MTLDNPVGTQLPQVSDPLLQRQLPDVPHHWGVIGISRDRVATGSEARELLGV